MTEEGLKMFDFFLDKISCIVLDAIKDGKIEFNIDEHSEEYWGEKPVSYSDYLDSDVARWIEEQEVMYEDFLKCVDQSYLEELAEQNRCMWETRMVA